MKTYRSNAALFEATRTVAVAIESGGHPEAAAELLRGLSAINGLTDGWALFLEAIDSISITHSERFGKAVLSELQTIREAARSAVFR
jgi:hypothetical protein